MHGLVKKCCRTTSFSYLVYNYFKTYSIFLLYGLKGYNLLRVGSSYDKKDQNEHDKSGLTLGIKSAPLLHIVSLRVNSVGSMAFVFDDT